MFPLLGPFRKWLPREINSLLRYESEESLTMVYTLDISTLASCDFNEK